jgi:hypothetical protein
MKVTLMADIPLRADVSCEEFGGVLEIRDAQLRCPTSESHPRALPQQLDNATGYAGCQIKYVVDRGWVVDRRFNSRLH